MDDDALPPDHSIRHLEGWSDASSYALADATMLRRELVVGYVVAGFLAVLVPTSWWGDVFVHGHGTWTSVENALVGPLIAVVSWVCSVGNVPLAAALWHGGISFGGVVAFIFGDLIAMPLILIYRKFYGGALTVRLVATLYGVMVVAGLVTEVLFRSLGLVPANRTLHVGADHVTWNYTTFLNLASLAVAGTVWVLARRRRRGGSTSYAIDPICKMQVRTSDAPARAKIGNHTYYFCSDHCHDRFLDEHGVVDDQKVAAPRGTTITLRARGDVRVPEKVEFIDPICGMTVTPGTAVAQRFSNGHLVYFCAAGCATEFDRRQLVT
jgi:YHS domain-containing protein